MRLLLLCALFLVTSVAHSGNLELNIQLTTQVTGSQATLSLTFTNQGDSPILDIQPKLSLLAAEAALPAIPKLLSGQRLQIQHLLTIPETRVNANFFAPVYVSYSDRVGERTTTVALASFRSNMQTPKLFNMSLAAVDIGADCRDTTVTIQPLVSSGNALSMRLVTPPGITVTPDQYDFSSSATNKSMRVFTICIESRLNNGLLPFHVIATTRHANNIVEEAVSAALNIRFKSLPARFFNNRELILLLAAGALAVLLLSGLLGIWRRS